MDLLHFFLHRLLSHNDFVKNQMAALKISDHRLFDDVVRGLHMKGWIEKGGSENFRLLSREGEDSTIKVFRDSESPEVIKICYTAPPENEESEEKKN